MRQKIRQAAAALAVCAALLLSAPPAAARQQSASASLRGVVTDPNGAVVVGAIVRATNVATRAARETRTNDEGAYTLSNLPPGDYEVRVEAKGFVSETSESPVALRVGQTVTLDVPLQVGSIGEVVNLVGYVPLVDTQTSKVDRVIDGREIENLPLNGRNFLELSLLTPGNAPAPNFDPTKTNTVVISSAGQFGRGGSVTVDGADTNDDVVGGAVQNVSQDAVQEFQIATNRFDARLGRTGSGVVNVVTKQGTNEFHGSAAAYFRGSLFQGLPATFDRTLNDEPPFDREQYSFTLGGPLKRDHAWFFGSLEYRNQDGAVLVGARDTARRTITRGFADAPLDDLLSTERFDWQLGDAHRLGLRYSVQREEAVSASTLIRSIGSASQRQSGRNRTHSLLADYTNVLSPVSVNEFLFSYSTFSNTTVPLTTGPQLTFPSIQDGVSFRVPQATKQRRFQFTDNFTTLRGTHDFRFGGEVQRVLSDFDLGVFRQGRVELIEDFPDFDRDGDGRVDDNDLLFAVTLRSAFPDRDLVIPDADNTYLAAYAQDDWRVTPNLTLNLGLRYELDTDVKNVSRYPEGINPLVRPFLRGGRKADRNNFAPRAGFNWSTSDGDTSVHGGYGVYYDRVTLQIQSLERGLDGRALPVEVRAGNLFFIPEACLFNPACGQFPPPAPTLADPFTGFLLPGAGAGGINIIDDRLQNPSVQQFNVGLQRQFGRHFVLRADYLHNFGTHFIIGRTIGQVFNPVVGGPDFVQNLESSVKTKYDGLLMSFERRRAGRYQFRASYTLSKAFNYANDDQIPFSNGPIDPNNLQLEYGPTPNDQRHRFAFAGVFDAPYGFRLAPLWTLASGVPMDILLPDGSSRVPALQRNAGGRLFKTGSELNAFIAQLNAATADPTRRLPLVREDARFSDSFNSFDLRLSRPLKLGERVRLEPIAEVFNLFNVTNVLGVSNVNYSGFSNVLARDSQDPSSPGFLRSDSFGRPVTTAGGVFGSGGPRAFQFAARVTF
ncbi:MAG TPA: TonB-dependent receptor [Pyrinomonadaceae bacterium]|nr:TonB-dependent receptor [Pyrinomonadaceae bacterium]